ncbi:alpha/beta fold hydrolase [Actinomadura roseirufa]|uniref:alpha/beta fold hydrolase n=1 Tax=Actinomadura roseirufa TaxID=2094049 RepID=UPI001A956125|nr:alpha/beta hydrolase [Actinomadura roseirufa]
MTELTTGMAAVNGIRMHYTRAGTDGPLLVLLHGWPQTGYMWRHLIEPLAEKYVVVAPDLRGYGHSDKPLSGYDKRTMAEDVSALMRHLGHENASVIGHDRGGRVAHRWGLDRPDEVEQVVILDIIPTREVLERLDRDYAARQWHWMFHLQGDLPELLAGSNIGAYLGYFFEKWTFNRSVFDPETVARYVAAFSAPGALRASFDDYRESWGTDAEHDNADHEAGRKLTMPLQVLWGATGSSAALPTVDIWSQYAENVIGAPIPECGHFLPEERPDEVLAELRTFLTAFTA